MKINLHVWFYFIVFFTILYITCETGHMELSVLLSLSASCFFPVMAYMHQPDVIQSTFNLELLIQYTLSICTDANTSPAKPDYHTWSDFIIFFLSVCLV